MHTHLFFLYKFYIFSNPFDQNADIGYAIALCIQIAAVWKFSAIFCSINTFYVGVCRYVDAAIDDLIKIFGKMDDVVLNQSAKKLKRWEIDLLLKRYFIEVVEFHHKILRWAGNTDQLFLIKVYLFIQFFFLTIIRFTERFADLVSEVIFLTFSIGILWLCAAMFQFQVHLFYITKFQNFKLNTPVYWHFE